VFLAVAAAVVALSLKQLGYASHISTFAIACFMLPVMTQVKVRAAELRGLKWVVWSQLPEKIIRLVVLIVGVFFLAYGANISVSAPRAMGVHLFGWVAGLLLVVLIARRAYPSEAKNGISEGRSEEWLSTSRDMMLIAGFNLVLFQADTIMVGALAGTTDAGLYAVASKLASLMIFVLLAVNSILGPVAAELHARGEVTRLQRVVTLATWGIFVPSMLLGVGLLLFDVQALRIFGEEFVQSDGALKFLIGGQLINAMAGPANLLLNMTGHQRESAKILGGSAVLNIVLNATLIPTFGFVGAASATAVTMLVWNGLAVWMVWRTLNIVAFTLPWHPHTQYE
jgi:O-antigen/teichoic acid export membrane protein